jgi:hypothetical protein
MLLGYHYALQQQSKQLAKERSEIQKRKDSAIAASIALHKARNDASYTNNKRHCRHGSRVENLEHLERRSLSKNLDSSFLSVDEQGNIIPKTPEAALVAAQTYQYTTRPSPGDPREHMHRAALQGLKMVGNKLADEVLTWQCPCLRAFDQWSVCGRLADSTASDRNRGAHEFTQVRPPRG